MKKDEFQCPGEAGGRLIRQIQRHLVDFEATFHLSIAVRGQKVMSEGQVADLRQFHRYLEHLLTLAREKRPLGESEIRLSLNLVENGRLDEIRDQLEKPSRLRIGLREVAAKTLHQREYIEAMDTHDVVFGIGPAGTGKTFLAIAQAVRFLQTRRVERIVLTRPVVEAGEKLGFLPGDIQQKVNPYFRPLYDALYYLIGPDKTQELIDNGTIEIAPLAYMRGRTISGSFIILDEGQNTLPSQMKMFLTRFGPDSRVVVTADLTQIDLDTPKQSGIFPAVKLLSGIEGISLVELTEQDIVRHPLVHRIIQAYEKTGK